MYISFYWPVPQLEYETDLTFVDICLSKDMFWKRYLILLGLFCDLIFSFYFLVPLTEGTLYSLASHLLHCSMIFTKLLIVCLTIQVKYF